MPTKKKPAKAKKTAKASGKKAVKKKHAPKQSSPNPNPTPTSPFDPVDPKQSFPDLEEGILRYWREEDIFQRSMSHRDGVETFSFYDGPPFATGVPHYGHLLAGTIKDVIPRYQTMRGKRVRRRFGWDCHGLPVENMIEREHMLHGKKEIEALGIAQFNDLCRTAVQRYTGEWRKTVERMGRWVDMDWDYRTMDPDYMESIWWVFKQLHDKGMIYEGFKPMHVCIRCVTPLSNFEVTQGYKDRRDLSVVVTFPLRDDPKTSILAWTTTPWSLPGNFFLAMGADLPYVRVRQDDKEYIVAKPLVEKVFGRERYEIVSNVSAHEFVGKKYVPLFDHLLTVPIPGNPQGKTYGDLAYEVVLGEMVDVNEGTGIVHLASAYGDDGFDLSIRKGIGVRHHITPDGKFTDDVKEFAGKDVKPAGDMQATDKAIAKYLDAKGRLLSQAPITHSYPHCWRCDTPLLNYASSSWFVSVEKIKERMIAVNKQTEWVPAALRDGRFGKWLDGARDWAISRSRYWGTPLPIWRNTATGEIEVIGSRDALMQRAPGRFTKVTITRHAQSEGNVAQIYQGNAPGTPLTALGKKQAADLAGRIGTDPLPVAMIYHSPLQRTTQTAQAVAGATGATLTADDRLREVAFGAYEGRHVDFNDLTFVKARRAHKLDTKQVESIYHFPGMETWAQVETRCKDFLTDILQRHRGEHIVIVTHADVLMNFTHLFTGLDKHKIVHQPYPALAGSRTFYFDHDTQQQMDLHRETVDGILLHGRSFDAARSVTVTTVRHGETEWNASDKIQGKTDVPLNEAGRKQATTIAATLNPEDYDVIVSSDLLRAQETAQIIATALGGKPVTTSPLFREQDLGHWEGKTTLEILKEFPAYARDFLTQETHVPGGEHRSDFLDRVRAGRDELLKNFAGKRVLLVSHRRWICALAHLEQNLPIWRPIENASVEQYVLSPHLERIPEVLDCWFESGAMPYAQEHFPFEEVKTGVGTAKQKSMSSPIHTPMGFPADFIAEGVDQTRGWFYTLTVLSTALFDQPAFRHCVVNGIVLAADGKKMSKSLKNYPEPLDIVHTYGADAVRFALMSSPAVRAEDLRFSEALVEDTLRGVLLPLWNAYNLFVTYANATQWQPPKDFSLKNATPVDPLDVWIIAKTQELVNRMTTEIDGYDLSATCAHLSDSIDGLTNWYIRLSRRRFAGKGAADQAQAFDTLYRVILTNCQLLAPFCPFLTDAMYLNLVDGEHSSIHLTDWPQQQRLTKEQEHVIALMRNTQTIVTLGLSLRSEAKRKVRQPLASVTFALSPSDTVGVRTDIIKDELNVKEVKQIADPGALGKAYVQVDARKVGPRLGARVQEIIKAGKAGQFEQKDGRIVILGETLSTEEAKLMYAGAQGMNIASDRGIVVSLDTTLTDALKLEGLARDVIRVVQALRKESGLTFTDTIALSIAGPVDIVGPHGALLARETKSVLRANDGTPHDVKINDQTFVIQFETIVDQASTTTPTETFDEFSPQPNETSATADSKPLHILDPNPNPTPTPP